MKVRKIDIFKTKARSIKATLENASEKARQGRAGIGLAENFNQLLKEVSEEFPDLKDSLPKPISSKGPFARAGVSDSSYLDLEIFSEQVLSLLDLVDKS